MVSFAFIAVRIQSDLLRASFVRSGLPLLHGSDPALDSAGTSLCGEILCSIKVGCVSLLIGVK